MEIVIRPIQATENADMERVVRAVIAEFGDFGPGSSLMDAELTDLHGAYQIVGRQYFVAVAGGQVIGGAGIAPLDGGEIGVCELRKMYLCREVRGQGVGRRMLTECIQFSRNAGYHTIYLETLATMAAARALYESVGFKLHCGVMGKTGHYQCDTFYLLDLGGTGTSS